MSQHLSSCFFCHAFCSLKRNSDLICWPNLMLENAFLSHKLSCWCSPWPIYFSRLDAEGCLRHNVASGVWENTIHCILIIFLYYNYFTHNLENFLSWTRPYEKAEKRSERLLSFSMPSVQVTPLIHPDISCHIQLTSYQLLTTENAWESAKINIQLKFIP